MYQIINTKNGTQIGAVDKVIYIKIGASGDFAPTTEDNAIGVALNGVAYNLLGHEEIKGADTVVVSEVDGGALIAEQQRIIVDHDTMSIDQEYRLTLLELGLSETDI